MRWGLLRSKQAGPGTVPRISSRDATILSAKDERFVKGPKHNEQNSIWQMAKVCGLNIRIADTLPAADRVACQSQLTA